MQTRTERFSQIALEGGDLYLREHWAVGWELAPGRWRHQFECLAEEEGIAATDLPLSPAGGLR